MSNNNENFFTKKHTKATHRGRYVLMVLYAFYAFASQGFFTAIISTAIVSAIIYFVIDAMWKSIGKNAKEQREKEFLKEHVRGVELWGKRGYENYLVATEKGLTGDQRKIYAHEVCEGHKSEDLSSIQQYLRFAGTFLPPEIENLHIAITASTGAGKSVALRGLISEIKKRGDRAIVIDNGYEFFQKFGSDTDYLLNPFDSNSKNWNLVNEIRQDFEWTKFARSIIPEGHGSEKEWNKMAQALIANIGINTGADNKTLLEIATSYSIKQLEPILSGTSSAVLLHEGGERLLTNIRSVFATYLQAWQFAEGGDFSLRDYVLGTDPSWLWIPFRENELEVSKQLITAWLDIIVNSGLERAEGQNPKTWVILDELDTLGELSSLIAATTKLRKRNMPIVTAFQSYSQLEENYGANKTQTLLNCFSSKLIMRTSSAKLAETMSVELGDREVWQSGQKTGVDRKGDEEHKKTERLVMASELGALPNLEGYLKLAGDYPVVKVKFEYQ